MPAKRRPAILLPTNDVEGLLALTADGPRSEITVDLPSQVVVPRASGERIGLNFDPVHKEMRLRGISAVDATLERLGSIETFERACYAEEPWLG